MIGLEHFNRELQKSLDEKKNQWPALLYIYAVNVVVYTLKFVDEIEFRGLL